MVSSDLASASGSSSGTMSSAGCWMRSDRVLGAISKVLGAISKVLDGISKVLSAIAQGTAPYVIALSTPCDRTEHPM
jgi:hypothetical protein